jgi:hypothetical protein
MAKVFTSHWPLGILEERSRREVGQNGIGLDKKRARSPAGNAALRNHPSGQ